MSDLADAVFGGQLLGHVIDGEELTASIITDAAMKADMASHLVVDDGLSTAENYLLQAKVAQSVIQDDQYDMSRVVIEHSDVENILSTLDA